MQNNDTNTADFRFLMVKCRDCSCDFVVTPQQQRWLLERSLSIPSHCPSCLLQRKLQRKIEQATNNGQGGVR